MAAKALEKVTKEQLSELFPIANIHISSDSEAAAIACCGNDPGYIHIIGTGSSVNFWNGSELEYPVTNLGFLWEDYASGYDIGKTIIRYWKESKLAGSEEGLLINKLGNLDQFISSLYQAKNYKKQLATWARH